ncbi:mercury(II) reductase [Tautonia sociabilis]|uniref:Mercuric reductase n=1 Tax=Tautonia sociabilis TaxID=2080755 RepID=A0A432MF37_9BACT|nr:mercury(II) reductase [Tautonia sociabilis]RUL84389.1 mercury(II) reductase [Tautonia sociabilis]
MADAFDLVILGSGSTAFAASLTAQELGKTAVMTEERTIGGTCVNRGCLPSKNLIEASKLMHDAREPRYPGLSGCELGLDFSALIAQKDEVIHGYRQKKYESLLGGQFRIERGHVEFVDSNTVEVDGKRLSGEKVLIATGSRPVIPAIEGLDSVPFITSDLLTNDEPMELEELPKSLLIVGGGYIALELGQMFSRFGSEVIILERSEQLLPRGYEPEVGRAIGQALGDEGLRIVTHATVTRVRQDGGEVVATVRAGGREREFRAEKLLVATGRRPNSDNIAIERAGVSVGPRGEVEVDEFLRTSVPHIFAAGDVIGGQWGSQMATPVGSRQGGIVAQNAFSGGEMRRVDHRVIPRVIFTDPQIAVVGQTEEEAIAAGHPCWCNTLPMTLVPRAGAIRDTRGIIKMVADAKTHEVLGVAMVGSNAGEVIHEAAMALRFGARIQDFIDLLHVYPTMAEALKIVAISRFKDPAKLSCCAE